MVSRVLDFSELLHIPRRLCGVIIVLAAASVLSACGLSSEPKVVSVLPTPTAGPTLAPTSSTPDAGYPVAMPEVAQGAQVFAANCTKCHGVGGKGDGELVKAGSIPTPGDFTNPDKLGGQTPLDVFKTITNGRLDKLMPPWGGGIAEANRWAVALYVYTLSYTPEQIALGDKLAGSDTLVSNGALNRLTNQYSQQQTMINLSDKVIETQISADSAVQSMTPEQRRALVIYLRRRTLAGTGSPTPAPAVAAQVTAQNTPQSAATVDATKLPATGEAQGTGVINGTITNGTAGGKVPPNLNLVLHILDQNGNETTQNTTADANNAFSFKNVPIRQDRQYVITTNYLDRAFGSDFVTGDPAKTTMELPVKIYELTSAPDVIKLTSLTTQVNASGDQLQIAQVIHIQNTSDKLFTGNQKIDEDRYPSITFALPKGASIMGFATDESRYSIAQDGTTITDTAPVIPGDDHVMHVIYTMPYKDGMTVEQPIPYALDGMVQLLLQPETMTAQTDQLASLGVQTQAQRNATYQAYANGVKLTPGSVLKYELHGSAAATTTSASGNVVSRELIIGLLVGAGIGIVLVGIVFMVRDRMVGRKPDANEYDPATQQRIDALIEQLAQLDDQFSSGQVDKKSYEKRRQRLKIRLSRLMTGAEG
ncbi:MAG: c-type cytochrome [Anaerolineae bacterium]|nr:c-type cytochrome [Anaerolineae bacterium]